MPFTKETAVERAKQDLAHRLGVTPTEIEESSVEDREFRDMSLGAPEEGGVAAQMISYGWQIILKVNGLSYDYRGDKYQLRLHDFEGKNYLIEG